MVRKPGFCRNIISSIDNVQNEGIRVSTKSVITPYNILTIPRLYRELRRKGAYPVRLAMYMRSGFHHTDDLFNHVESYSWLEKQVDQLKEEFPEDMVNVQNGGPILEPQSKEVLKDAWPQRSTCTSGRSSMMVCADGKVIPCEQMPETEEYFVGDLTTQSLHEVWTGKKLASLTTNMPDEKFIDTVCHGCEEIGQCHDIQGYCIRDNSIRYGSVYTPAINCPKNNMPFERTV